MKKDKEKTTINIKHFLALFFLIGISQAALCDDVQNALNLDYFRTPEASAFKKYGEELVNEYTGTADISVPLYTIKCKDIEIPLVLRYDASGIKVEQEASWVGLGWNLMVGGCINYVCAGGHDMFGAPFIPDSVWTEYLTSEFSSMDNSSFINSEVNLIIHKTQTRYYRYNPQESSNWMGNYPLSPQNFVFSYVDNISPAVNIYGMKEYVDWGYGERDFYSVNVLGKSFMFFIDPFTLKVFNIGKEGEKFRVEPDYVANTCQAGVGNQPDVYKWRITDSSGYIYEFEEGDKFQHDSRTGMRYTSCWYLTKIKSPLGEEIEFTYTEQESNRVSWQEKINVTIVAQGFDNGSGPRGHDRYNQYARVKSHYLSEIKTRNQTVLFDTSESKECSGRRLNGIKVLSYDSTEIKNIKFSYGSFGHSNVGGSYAPAQDAEDGLRLKLENVKEMSSSDTLATSFSYNSLNLPSKRSFAQDYWGYYNGKENKISGQYTLIPTPNSSSPYTQRLKNYDASWGADRYSRDNYMQAAMLNRVDYPTGGYTTYEYETNRVRVNTFAETQKYIEKSYDVSKSASFSVSENPSYSPLQMDSVSFWLNKELKGELYLRCSSSANIDGEDMNIYIFKWPTGGETSVSGKIIPAKFNRSQGFSYVDSITLSPGRYTLMVAPPNVSIMNFGATCQLRGFYTETLTDESEYYVLCGGLRVKKISNYDNDGQKINYTTYDYSGGLLLDEIETTDCMLCYLYYRDETHVGQADVFTITPGHSRMPAFYASCNPGIVGYSNVVKSKFNANGNLEKSVATSYINDKPTNMYGIEYYSRFNNGAIINQETRDASGNIVSKTENTYGHDLVDHYYTNMMAKYKIIGETTIGAPPSIELDIIDAPNILPTKTITTSGGDYHGVADIVRYPYILSRDELSQSVTTEYCPDSSTIVKTKDYIYNGINHQVSQIDENTSLSSQTLRTKITYSADGEDYMSRWMQDAHRLNDVVENKTLLVENGQEHCISTQHTNYTSRYNNGTSHYLPASLSTSIGDNAPETRAVYSYDDSLNVCSIVVDSMETVYIWSYKGQYPIAKIEGLTYAEVQSAVGTSAISILLSKPQPTSADLSSIRNAVNGIGGHVTTYTYKPLVGIESMTQPNGNTVYYEYDSFARLTRVIDHDGSVISTNSYNYRKP